jgi:hypothetical protein
MLGSEELMEPLAEVELSADMLPVLEDAVLSVVEVSDDMEPVCEDVELESGVVDAVL